MPYRNLVSVFPIEHFVRFLFAAGRFFSEQSGEDGQPVDLLGGSGATKFGQGGEDVGLIKNVITDLAGFDLTGPTGEEGNAQTSLVEASFPSAKLDLSLRVNVGSEETTGHFLRPEAVLASVVTSKEDNGVFLELEFFQEGEDLSELPVDHGDHDGIVLGIFRYRRVTHPFFTLVELPCGFVFGDVEHPVGRGEREVAKEGIVLVLFDKAKGFVHDRVLGVGSP